MLADAVKEFLSSFKTAESPPKSQPIPSLPPSLALERKEVLICLVAQVQMNRTQIEGLAQTLYNDLKQGQLYTLADSCQRAAILKSINQQLVYENPVLNRIALSYEPAEMEKVYDSSPIDPNNPHRQPNSLVDVFAGSGPPRKLIKELYSLRCLSALAEIGEGGNEIFAISHQGRAHARVIEILMQNINWEDHGNPMIVVGRRSTQAISFPNRN